MKNTEYEVLVEVNSYVDDISFMWNDILFFCRSMMFGRIAQVRQTDFIGIVDKHPSFRSLHLNVVCTDRHSLSRLRSEIEIVKLTPPGQQVANRANIVLDVVGLNWSLAGAFPVWISDQRLPGSEVHAQFYVDTYARLKVRSSTIEG